MILIRLYLSIYNTDLLYGEIKGAYMAMKKIEKLTNAKDKRVFIGLNRFAKINIDALEGKISISKAKEEIEKLSKEYPEAFLIDREEVGDAEKACRGYIHRLEYAINRYDVKYPYFNMQRCDDL